MARSVGISRERVVVVAAELADRQGLEHLTLARVATELGVRLPSLYNHVDGLPGLRRELAVRGCRQLLERLSRAAIGKTADTAVIAVAQAIRSYVLEHPGVYAATVRAPTPDDHELQELSRSIVDVVVAVLEPFNLADEATVHVVRALRGISHGFASLELAGGFGLPLDRDESFLRLLHTYLAGLRSVQQTAEQ